MPSVVKAKGGESAAGTVLPRTSAAHQRANTADDRSSASSSTGTARSMMSKIGTTSASSSRPSSASGTATKTMSAAAAADKHPPASKPPGSSNRTGTSTGSAAVGRSASVRSSMSGGASRSGLGCGPKAAAADSSGSARKLSLPHTELGKLVGPKTESPNADAASTCSSVSSKAPQSSAAKAPNRTETKPQRTGGPGTAESGRSGIPHGRTKTSMTSTATSSNKSVKPEMQRDKTGSSSAAAATTTAATPRGVGASSHVPTRQQTAKTSSTLSGAASKTSRLAVRKSTGPTARAIASKNGAAAQDGGGGGANGSNRTSYASTASTDSLALSCGSGGGGGEPCTAAAADEPIFHAVDVDRSSDDGKAVDDICESAEVTSISAERASPDVNGISQGDSVVEEVPLELPSPDVDSLARMDAVDYEELATSDCLSVENDCPVSPTSASHELDCIMESEIGPNPDEPSSCADNDDFEMCSALSGAASLESLARSDGYLTPSCEDPLLDGVEPNGCVVSDASDQVSSVGQCAPPDEPTPSRPTESTPAETCVDGYGPPASELTDNRVVETCHGDAASSSPPTDQNANIDDGPATVEPQTGQSVDVVDANGNGIASSDGSEIANACDVTLVAPPDERRAESPAVDDGGGGGVVLRRKPPTTPSMLSPPGGDLEASTSGRSTPDRSASRSPAAKLLGVATPEIPPINVVKSRPVAAKEFFSVASSGSGRQTRDGSSPDADCSSSSSTPTEKGHVEDANHNVVKSVESPDAVTPCKTPPLVALSSCAVRGGGGGGCGGPSATTYVPSRRPLSQIYGGTDLESLDETAPSSSAHRPLTTRHSCVLPQMVTSPPTTTTSVVDGEITSKIRLARSCSRNGINQFQQQLAAVAAAAGISASGSTTSVRSGGGDDAFNRRRAESFRGLLRVTDSRSIENFRSPSLVLGFPAMSHASSVRSSLCATGRSAESPMGTPTGSQNTSPSGTPSVSRCSSGILSSGGSSTLRTGGTSTPVSTLIADDDLRSSLASLASVSSSIYSNVEERQSVEIRKLKQELEVATEKIDSLSTQLNVNMLMLSTYEQNIDSLTKKLKHVTSLLEQKDNELAEFKSSSKSHSSNDIDLETIPDSAGLQALRRQPSNASSTLPNELRNSGVKPLQLSRHISCESVNSINSQSSSCSMNSQQSASMYTDKKKGKKKNWLRNSFVKAFSRKKSSSSKMDSVSWGEADAISIQSDVSGNENGLDSVASSTVTTADIFAMDRPFQDLSKACDLEDQLHERDVELTESRLESLASFHHIQQLEDHIAELEKEVLSLKTENRSLKRLLLSCGSSSHPSVAHGSQLNRDVNRLSLRQRSPAAPHTADVRLSVADPFASCRNLPGSHSQLSQKYSLSDLASEDSDDTSDAIHHLKVVFVPGEFTEFDGAAPKPVNIGELSLTRLTNWRSLDTMVCDVFTEYLEQIDPGAHLGLDAQCILGYHLGEVTRTLNAKMPDNLPAVGLSDKSTSVQIIVKGWRENSVDSLALETLVPKVSLLQYVSLVLESRRLVICGPTGTGKTYLASKLANHVMLRCNKSVSPNSVSTFVVDSKSVRDLQGYIAKMVHCCQEDGDSARNVLPTVLVVDNMQYVSSLTDVFGSFITMKSNTCPYFIGTMNQSRKPSNADLQLRQSFRWVLLTPPLEPVSGLLPRHLRRNLAHLMHEGGIDKVATLRRIIDWLPTVYQHVNKSAVALSTTSSTSIGPAIFFSCPMDVEKSRTWFIDLWNTSIIPYLTQLSGECTNRTSANLSSRVHRGITEDPTGWVLESFPWPKDNSFGGSKVVPPLVRLKPESDTIGSQDRGPSAASSQTQHSSTTSGTEDHVFEMLLKLQEVTNQSSGSLSHSSANSSRSSLTADLECCRYANGSLNTMTTVHSAVS